MFLVMFTLGPMLGGEQIAAALRRRTVLLAVMGVMVLVDLPAVGAAFAWRDPAVRPAAAMAAAICSRGLALVIATVNRAPPSVTAATIGSALGLGLTIVAYLPWRKRR
ncbi:MAG: hypothetical protein IT517_04125 [Burkholderiales bacterium]|nr:hypothetical protein [Burkholderiales bacterium]